MFLMGLIPALKNTQVKQCNEKLVYILIMDEIHYHRHPLHSTLCAGGLETICSDDVVAQGLSAKVTEIWKTHAHNSLTYLRECLIKPSLL